MLFATTEVIPGDYEILGVVGSVVAPRVHHTPNGVSTVLSSDILDKAHQTLGEQAAKLDGNGVIGIRYTFSSSNDVLVTGTAIRISIAMRIS